jgi:hypothetical protein
MEAMNNFRPINRDTGLLLPPVDEWLPQRHLGEGSPNRMRALWSDYGMAVLHSLLSPRFWPLSQQ